MKYLKEFENHSQYAAYSADTFNFTKPNVSTCILEGDVHYNIFMPIPLDDAIITCDSPQYNGETQIATNIVVTLSGKTLSNGFDYEVTENDGGINAGSYNIVVEGIGNYIRSKNGTFTIVKAIPIITAPTPRVLTYDGSAQELVNAGSTNFGTLKYSLDGTSYSTSIPTATNYGSYTVYYKVEGDSNVNDTEPSTVLCSINEKQVTATVELSQDECTYDGTAQEPTVTVKDGSTVIDPSEYTVTYSNNTNAGTATVTISDNEGGNYEVIGSATFTINKADPTYTAPTANNNTYSGSEIALLNLGSTSDGSFLYSDDDTSWDISSPKGTNAGSYISYWKLVGDINHNDVESTSVTTTISKANQAAPTAYGSTTTYPTTATASASGGGGVGSLIWESAQSQASVGSHTTRCYWSGNANYNSSPWSNYATVQMNKANQAAPTAYGSTTTYPTTATASASGGGGVGSLVWDGSQSQTSVGYHNTRCYWSGNANYNASTWSNYVTVQMNKASQSAPTAYGSSVSYGSTATATASGGGGAGSIEWSNGNTRTAVGSQSTQARWSGNGNYNASSWSNSVTLSVSKANQSAPTAYGDTKPYAYYARATASGGGGQGSLEWSNGNVRTEVGSQDTQARWGGNSNYNASSWSNTVTLTITKANQSAPTAYGDSVEYGSTATATASGGGGIGSLEWSNGNTRTAVGSQTTRARWSGNGNYNASDWSNEVTLTVAPDTSCSVNFKVQNNSTSTIGLNDAIEIFWMNMSNSFHFQISSIAPGSSQTVNVSLHGGDSAPCGKQVVGAYIEGPSQGSGILEIIGSNVLNDGATINLQFNG